VGHGAAGGAARRGLGPAAIALLGLAVGAQACGSDGPSLTLVFHNLPRTIDSKIVVQLSAASDGLRFSGMDTPGQGVSVTYADDGTIQIEIDRQWAADRGDQIRLPLTAPDALSLRARATVFQNLPDMIGVETVVSVRPGQSVTLTFDFGAILDAGLPDAGIADGGAEVADVAAPEVPGAETAPETSPPIDAGPDVAADLVADGPPDSNAGGDGPGDDRQTVLPPDGGIPTNCVVAPPHPASVGATVGALAIGYAAGPRLFGFAWSGAGNVGLFYNAVDATGTLASPAADATIPLGAGVATVGTPRLAGLGSQLALAYGQRDSGGQTQAMVARIAAAGGAVQAGAEAPAFWVLADPEGNEACITTWQGRD